MDFYGVARLEIQRKKDICEQSFQNCRTGRLRLEDGMSVLMEN